MKRTFFTLLILLAFFIVAAQTPAIRYPVDSASIEHPGVPKGEVLKYTFSTSTIFPGTTRDYWIYIPAQYRPETPACVYVNQDGIQWKAPTVFDNLIFRHEMPVTIGIFIQPGRLHADDTAHALDRFNRSLEYDGLGDAYARFLLDELLPDVEKKKAGDGRAIRLSRNGNDRAIGGSSSGAICAFTAAWECPREFSRVFSAIGTYVGLRGGDRYPSLIRKTEPRALRIFLQDGSNDLNIYGGDWWKANETMERALVFSGYEVNHSWGEDGHNGHHGESIFPDAMRWLWKDWPKPVTVGSTKNQALSEILIPGQDWELVGQGYQFTEGIAANAKGEVFFQDIPNSKTYKIDADGKPQALPLDAKKASGTCFGPDGKRVVVAGGSNQILSYDNNDKVTILADALAGNDLVVAKNGNIYVTVPDGTEKPSKIYLIRPNGGKVVVDEGIRFANGIALTPDQSQLYITESASHWVWIYSIRPDGTLANKQHYGWLQVPDNAENAWPDGLKCDREGRVYVTSRMGIQILDPVGRVNAILPIPTGQASNCCFGGPGFDVLYVTSRDKVYRRRLNVHGANPFDSPNKPGAPRL
ncbi:MAG: SMP-30/gluconolactonase/LRE family protein [Bacteroidota bacterium]|nr:SMP-30/gluconolactonase/LRE family protein [Bacteroidota bacterium]MDP4216356.1 SMP-30/gluconolactonase/LRE family protein [Bacteroidota bacterium]MDP4247599.1 SMP-30/gluconolactonase/LRE family protein [Bacteroidota bacterium]MDP4256117.1 SMP-30/gluconolactonase/LRE family protein [Bacteroidota bacterium]MDP4257469.1 SMP-30/gluconolactonase/LRE family protein [Bacteroidota bacterium]